MHKMLKVLNGFGDVAVLLPFGMAFLLVLARLVRVRCVAVDDRFVQIILVREEIIFQVAVVEVLLHATVLDGQHFAAQVRVKRRKVVIVEMNLIFDVLAEHWKDNRHGGVHQRRRIHDVNFHLLDGQKIRFGRCDFHVARSQPLHHLPRVSETQNVEKKVFVFGIRNVFQFQCFSQSFTRSCR